MAGAHKVIYGEGDQAIRWTPDHRAASATYLFEHFAEHPSDSSDRFIASGSATLDPLNTTTDAVSGPEQSDGRFVYVASTVNVTASHRYIITHVDNNSFEVFTAQGSFADTYILAESPLLQSYPTGSAVQGITVEATFPEAVADDENQLQQDFPYRVIWELTSQDGRTQHHQELIRHVRHDFSDMAVDQVLEKVQSAWPDYATRFDSNYKIVNAIKFARDELWGRLSGRGIKPEEYLTGLQGELLLFWRTMLHLAMLGDTPGNRDPLEFKNECSDMVKDLWGDVTRGHIGVETSEVPAVHDQGTSEGAVKYRGIIRSL